MKKTLTISTLLSVFILVLIILPAASFAGVRMITMASLEKGYKTQKDALQIKIAQNKKDIVLAQDLRQQEIDAHNTKCKVWPKPSDCGVEYSIAADDDLTILQSEQSALVSDLHILEVAHDLLTQSFE